jgi:hypothetical protein
LRFRLHAFLIANLHTFDPQFEVLTTGHSYFQAADARFGARWPSCSLLNMQLGRVARCCIVLQLINKHMRSGNSAFHQRLHNELKYQVELFQL